MSFSLQNLPSEEQGEVGFEAVSHKGPAFTPGLAAKAVPFLLAVIEASVQLMQTQGSLYMLTVETNKNVLEDIQRSYNLSAEDIMNSGIIKGTCMATGSMTNLGVGGYCLRKNAKAGEMIKPEIKQAKAYQGAFKDVQKQGPRLTAETGEAAPTEATQTLAETHNRRCEELRRGNFSELSEDGTIAREDREALETVVDPDDRMMMEDALNKQVKDREAELAHERQTTSNQAYIMSGLGQAVAGTTNSVGTVGGAAYDQDKVKEDGSIAVENGVSQQLSGLAQRQASASDKANDMVPSITQSMNSISNANTLRA